MEILDRFEGRNGQITVAQERKTGARLYVEEGVKQSYVLPGGSAGLDYVRLMVRVLEGAPDIILFGCGGGALASELYNRGCRVTVVDDNPISFEIARRYFWMPSSILCVADGMVEFLEKGPGEYAAIGVDVGGPSFDYESTLTAKTCALLGRRLASGGRVAINIARNWAQDTILTRIADRLFNENLDVRILEEAPRKGRSALIVASKQARRGGAGILHDRGGECGRMHLCRPLPCPAIGPHRCFEFTDAFLSRQLLQPVVVDVVADRHERFAFESHGQPAFLMSACSPSTIARISASKEKTSTPAPFPASVTVGGWPLRNISR
jgi:hypothetical protein